MKRLLLALMLLTGPVPLAAQSPAFDRAIAEMDRIFADGADMDALYGFLTRTVRTSRAVGRNEPDFAIFYAMLADYVRNEQLNPVYALQIAEEGLELIAGDPAQQDFAIVLQITRSYALADLGRLREAHEQAQLVLPSYAALFDEQAAEDYRRDAENWGQGQLSAVNTAATELARQTLDSAYEQLESRAYGRVLTLASTALLPMNTGLPEGEVRSINTEAEMLMAKALGALGRHAQAGNAWLRALGYMTRTPWTLDTPPDWWGALTTDAHRAIVFDIFEGLADTAGLIGRADIEQAALAQASDHAATPRARYSVLLRRARLAMANDDPETGLGLLRDSRDTAMAAGNMLDLRVAEFYIALVEAQAAERSTGTVPSPRIIETARAALVEYRANLIAEEDFIYGSAARLLIRSDALATGLDFARRSMAALRARLAARDDTGFGKTQARRDARAQVEVFLQAAHLAASDGMDGRLAAPGCTAPRDFMGCTVLRRE